MIAEENAAQTKMDVTPPTLKGIDETVADYVPVEKVNPESAIVTPNKLLSDLAKEQDTALAKSKQDQIKLEDANNEPKFLATNPT